MQVDLEFWHLWHHKNGIGPLLLVVTSAVAARNTVSSQAITSTGKRNRTVISHISNVHQRWCTVRSVSTILVRSSALKKRASYSEINPP